MSPQSFGVTKTIIRDTYQRCVGIQPKLRLVKIEQNRRNLMLLQKRKGVIKRIKIMNCAANNVICVSYQIRLGIHHASPEFPHDNLCRTLCPHAGGSLDI